MYIGYYSILVPMSMGIWDTHIHTYEHGYYIIDIESYRHAKKS